MAITDTALRSMKAPSKATKVFDSGGLFILATPPSPRNPKGSKLWRLKYRIAGKEKLISFGPYPAISIKRARELRDEARTLPLISKRFPIGSRASVGVSSGTFLFAPSLYQPTRIASLRTTLRREPEVVHSKSLANPKAACRALST